MKLGYARDWEGARLEFERAQELDPNDSGVLFAWAAFHWMLGNTEEAIAGVKRWARSDPLSVIQKAFMTMFLINGGRLDEAREQIASALEIAPYFGKLHWYRGSVNILEGHYKEGVACMRKAVEFSNR